MAVSSNRGEAVAVSDGYVSGSGWGQLIWVTLAASVALGLLLTVFWYVWYLYILMPTIAGVLLGLALYRVVVKTYIRSRIVIAIVAVLGAVVMMLTFRYTDYIVDRERAVRDLQASGQVETRGDALDMLSEELVFETGQSGFVGFTQLIAQNGLGQSVVDDESVQFTEGAGGTYAYWVIEIGIIALLTIVIAGARTTHPFCLRDEAWLAWRSVGFIDRKDWQVAKSAFKNGDYTELKQYLVEDGKFEVQVAGCEKNSTDLAVRVYRHEGRFSGPAVHAKVAAYQTISVLFDV